MPLFRDSLALVTGASSGIGRELARQLAGRGANLVLAARSEDELRRLAGELSRAHGIDAHVVAVDLSRRRGVDQLCRAVDVIGVDLDHLINNAGFGYAGAFSNSDARTQRQMIRLNCEAPVLLTRYFLAGMIERGRGGVLNVASTASFQPMPFMATYGATKAFVLSFSAALSEELAGTRVRVTALCPGPVATRFQAVAGIEPGVERVAALSAEVTARHGLHAYQARRSVCVPGAVNQVQTVVSKLLPRSVLTRSIGSAMKRMGRAK
jgi:short-subunit dehydrogenase